MQGRKKKKSVKELKHKSDLHQRQGLPLTSPHQHPDHRSKQSHCANDERTRKTYRVGWSVRPSSPKERIDDEDVFDREKHIPR